MNIIEAIDDPKIFGKQVRHESYGAWRAFLAAMFGLPMTPAELAIYRECTGRETAPTGAFREAMLPTGRRAGKSFTLALIAVYLASFTDYRPYLAPGEDGRRPQTGPRDLPLRKRPHQELAHPGPTPGKRDARAAQPSE